ncbi:formate dehydrogenase accessory sulfurtransferase FdhD [Nocardioides pocheonensis]|uniref:Sulfur carrier protein FdhD n=1 Tax=Nocardioides pocheonensis TaxID=661485 RepID=A0A3N0GG51_9ACTN|nr:formate dehydrogenase accessory sulfurtransferase FdhD [Nocardioides pocheonensis]RNM11142.1 sulfurtransferase FdhD [Nocardioides pocheonensis]
MTPVPSVEPGGRARRPGPSVRTRVVEYDGDAVRRHEDRLATEEPLEIRLAWPGAEPRRLTVTMRTPGHDFELAVGWLVHEGILRPEQVGVVRYCVDADLDPLEEFNVVTVEATSAPLRIPDARTISSACGVCGSESIADVLGRVTALPRPADDLRVPLALVRELPARLREEQPGFDSTGGLHAAGLFAADGRRLVVREDVGRHNAVDKAVGALLLSSPTGGRRTPEVLVLSGRVGFELVQKAAVSGVGLVVAVGAPSSLAVQLAERAGLGLVGFTRPDRCVVYAGDHRLGV